MKIKRLYTYHVLFEKFEDDCLPVIMTSRVFFNEKNAQSVFLQLANEKCLPWITVMEGNDDYILIAEAGGITQQYRIMYLAHPIF